MSLTGQLHFLSHMRRGIGSARNETGQIPAQVTLRAGSRTEIAERVLSVMGPEHVTAIAPDQILRTVPDPGSIGFEPNIFAAIEFALPDLPWMMSPWAPDPAGRLAPWLVLVVVRSQAGVQLESRRQSVEQGGGAAALSVLRIQAPAEVSRELPDLAETWLWAHVQTTADLDRLDPAEAFATAPESFRARIICPRRLEPLTDYTACLVPATTGGARAGLGQQLQGDLHAPAWTAQTTMLELPVYFSWTFRTGQRGDFESLVRKLTPQDLSAGVAELGLADPGDPRLPASDKHRAPFKGALVGTSARPTTWPAEHRDPWINAMAEILATYRPAEKGVSATEYRALRDDPVIAPPMWGANKIGAQKAPDVEIAPDGPWFGAVNHWPGHRAAAGLGAEVVRRNQENLMAEAWQQAEGLREVNRVFNQTRLAAEVGAAIKLRKLDGLSDASALRLSTLAANRGKTANGVATAVDNSILPAAFARPALARLTRRRSVVGRRSGLDQPVFEATANLFVAAPEIAVRYAEITAPPGMAMGELVREIAAPGLGGTEDEKARFPGRIDWENRTVQGTDKLSKAARAGPVQRHVSLTRGPLAKVLSPQMTVVLQAGRQTIDPAPMLAARLAARVTAPGVDLGGSMPPPSHLLTPSFTTPFYSYLRKISPDTIMPGVTEVPLNSVGLALVNGAFVESVLLGANSELTREFLWREYPADLRGTYMRHFWDVPGGSPDIDPIAKWEGKAPLGHHLAGPGTDGTTVLLVKGEVLRRYPDLAIYASKAEWDDRRFRFEHRKDGLPLMARQPLFGGWLDRATAFFAFDLSLAELRGTMEVMGPSPGWFFVFEQARNGIQFGLDVPGNDRVNQPASWADLDWAHVLDPSDGSGPHTHLGVSGWTGTPALPLDVDLETETWGLHAAAQARITYQRPARALVHASAMLP
jgi:hypothetical protein